MMGRIIDMALSQAMGFSVRLPARRGKDFGMTG